MTLTRHERPIYFYGLLASAIAVVSALLGIPVVAQYLQSGMVPRFPTLLAAAFGLVISTLCLMLGLIIDGTRKSRYELSRLAYLRHPAVRSTYVVDPQLEAVAAPAPVTIEAPDLPRLVPAPRLG